MMEMTPEQAQSKFKLTESLQPPAKCVFCGRGKQEPMVTANLYIDDYGTLLICVFCAQQIAEVVQYGPVAELHLAQAEIVAKNEEIVELQGKLEEERENVRVLTRITASGDVSGDPVSGSDSVAVEAKPTNPTETKSRPRAGKVVSPKSSDRSSESSAG